MHQQSIETTNFEKSIFEKYSKNIQKTNILFDKTKPEKKCVLLSGQNLLAHERCSHRGAAPLREVFSKNQKIWRKSGGFFSGPIKNRSVKLKKSAKNGEKSGNSTHPSRKCFFKKK